MTVTISAGAFVDAGFSDAAGYPDSIQSQRQHTQFFLGAALAQADTTRKVITLDLVNTFPEIAAFDTLQEALSDVPEEINLGDICLGALSLVVTFCFSNAPR